MYKSRSTGTANGMRGTQGMGGMFYSGECRQIFRGMQPNIPGNELKHSGECCQTFREMKPMFGVNKENYWAESRLESCQTSMMELFCRNSQRPYYVDYFRKKTPPQMFDWISNVPPIGCAVNVECEQTASACNL